MTGSRRPLRVLFLARKLGIGGSERQLVTLAAALHRRGDEPSVAVFYGDGDLTSELATAGVPVHDLRKGGRWELFGFGARLIATIRAVDPDVVYSYLNVPNALAVLSRLAGIRAKVVWGIRNAGMDWRPYGWVPVIMARTESALSRGAHLLIANSAAGREQWLRQGISAERVVWIPNGIDCERFRPDTELGRTKRIDWGASGRPVVGIVARVDPVKDHGTLLRAIALVARRVPDVLLVSIGAGDPQHFEGMRALAARLNIDDRVRWLPAQADLSACYNAMDVCVLTSTSEGFPNVLGEAMACGTPCVATRVGDSERVLGSFGRVVEPRNPDLLAEAIIASLSTDDRARVNAAAGARARVLELFSVDQLTSRTAAALDAVVAGSPTPMDAAGLVSIAAK